MAALAVSLACGPVAPGETTAASEASTGASTGAPDPASSTDAATTTDPGTTASTSPATSGPTTSGPATTGPATTGPATTGPATTGPATSGPDPSTGAATTEPGVCVADPAAGICGDACDVLGDCCKCWKHTRPITDPTECTIAAGIVTGVCPWADLTVWLDDQWLAERQTCDDPGAMWTQTALDGDLVITLCGDTCTAFLDGAFAELSIFNSCDTG